MLVQVTVDGFETVGVTDDDIIAISFGLIVGQTHLAVESGVDSVVATDSEVDAFVHAAEASSVTVIGSDLTGAGHGESGDVDNL